MKKRKLTFPIAMGFILISALLASSLDCFNVSTLLGTDRFNETLLDNSRILNTATRLASKELHGRGLGEIGQSETEAFMEAYFDAHLKRADIEILTVPQLKPVWSEIPKFSLSTPSGSKIDFKGFEDFEPQTDGHAGGIDYKGNLIYAANDFFSLEPSLLRDQVVFFNANRLTPEHIDRALACGVKGIVYSTSNTFNVNAAQNSFNHKSLSLAHKLGSELFIAEISPVMASTLRDLAHQYPLAGYDTHEYDPLQGHYAEKWVAKIPNLTLKATLSYKKVLGKQYIVTYRSQPDRYSPLTMQWLTHYDGLGTGYSDPLDRVPYYPSALDGAGSTALLLEMARIVEHQQTPLANDLVFIFMSGLYINDQPAGVIASQMSQRYDSAMTYLLEGIGHQDMSGLDLGWDRYSDYDRIAYTRLIAQQDTHPFELTMMGQTLGGLGGTGGLGGSTGSPLPFSRYDAFKRPHQAFLTLTGQPLLENPVGTPEDRPDRLSTSGFQPAIDMWLGFAHHQIFRETDFSFIKWQHGLWLIGVLVAGYLFSGTETAARKMSHPIWTPKILRLCRHPMFRMLQSGMTGLLPLIFSLFIINMVLSLPSDFNYKRVGDAVMTNFSMYQTFKASYLGFIGFFSLLLQPEPALIKEVILYLKRSLILIIGGLIISMAFGLFKGLLDARFDRGHLGVSSLMGIALYSIPDVLIAFVSMVAVVYLSKIAWISAVIDPTTFRLYIMPLLALTIVPSLYAARLVYIGLEREKQTEYVNYLAYKGLSLNQIFAKHFVVTGFIQLLQHSKTTLMLLFSNLIVVEFLFNYPGIMSNILSIDVKTSADAFKIMILAISLGLSLTVINALLKGLLFWIHPMATRRTVK